VAVKVLNSVVDSLDVRVFRHSAPSQRLRRDAEVFSAVVADSEPGDPAQYVKLPGLGTFHIRPHGRAPYLFVLSNPQIADIRIWNPARWDGRACAQTGQFYISFRSVFLQRGGLAAARRVVAALVDLYCTPGPVHADAGLPFDLVARVDLAADTQEDRDMLWADLDRFVCRARKLDTWTHLTPADLSRFLKCDFQASALPMDIPAAMALDMLLPAVARAVHLFTSTALNELETAGEADLSRVVSQNRAPQTSYFGRFGSQLYARRYNKLGSLVVQNKLYMLDIWQQAGWDSDFPVWRTEFSLSGDFLRGFVVPEHDGDLRDLAQLESIIPALWEYLTGDWLRLTDPNEDTNRARWPTSPDWAVLQAAFGSTQLVGARDHARTVPREDGHLVLQARGCSVSTVALRSAALGSYDAALQTMVDDYIYKLTEDDFLNDVNDRMLEFGLDDFSDTAISALIRRERLQQAAGS
jgi:hypothetical protein